MTRNTQNTHRLSITGESAFTLIEILFALVLFGIATAAIYPAFHGHIRFNNFSEMRSASYSAAQILLDDLRLEEPSVLPSSGSDPAVDIQVGTKTFSVVASYCEDTTYCDTETRYITARVSYQGEQIYEVSTVYTELR